MITLRFDRRALTALDNYLETRRDRLPALFISSQMRRLTVQRAEQIVAAIAGELSFTRPDGTEKRVTPHTFRHGFATDLLHKGADLVSTSKLMNHNSIYTTRIYTHVNEVRQDEIYERFHSI
jgi:site-specific recombinase XerD